ncbi:MAG: aromatic amino acid hydroxylase [Bacteroidales bacterium]|nr:aromatic amino acid hydroxylase [Bacteroidales bacterium]
MESNDVLDRLPLHLHNLIIDQPYPNYTAQDQAVWRYIMRQNVKYLPAVAHSSYVEGLKRTGISTDSIPHMYGMNRILREIGWAAVAVDGFIPPVAFMEFQAHNVLVIAADIRPIDQVLYTPAPDIIHEAAGHAPIIADEEYSDYLRDFGRAGTKAFSSKYDQKMYEAIRHLSILKADPNTTFAAIEKAEAELDHLSKLQKTPSEMALLRNLHWWTVEYGLIGTVENPKIYGAGLLSSIGESHNCLKPKVKKLPYSIDAQNYSFDITTQQPQLFVTPDFKHLNLVLGQYLETMAVRKGGIESLKKALNSGATCTVEYSSGVQVSGKLVKIVEDNNEPVYLGFEGPSMLSFDNHQLEGQGVRNHKDGFGSPVGIIKGISGNIETMSGGELFLNHFVTGNELFLEFTSGVQVKGRLEKIIRKQGRNLVFSFLECTVIYLNKILFRPEWGVYDMAVGEKIISAFSGPADPDAFGLKYPAPKEKTHHIKYSTETLQLHELYETVRSLRENGGKSDALAGIWQILKLKYPDEWLLPLEIVELLKNNNDRVELTSEIVGFLKTLSDKDEEMQNLVKNGMSLFTNH